jgi:hypothetical protein
MGVWRKGGSTAQSLLAAERSARLDGARDVRVLGGPDERDLAPVVAISTARAEALALHCVVELRGYWGQACACTGDAAPATVAVDAMVDAARAGVTAGDVAAAALTTLGPEAAEVALAYGLGAGIGLDEEESPAIVPGSEAIIPAGTVLALQAVTRVDEQLFCAGATISVGEQSASRW